VLGAQRLHLGYPIVATNKADHIHLARFRKLHNHASDRTVGCSLNDPVARLGIQFLEQEVTIERHREQLACDVVRNGRRNWHSGFGRRSEIFCPQARAGRHGNLLPNRKTLNTRTEGIHHAKPLGSRNRRQRRLVTVDTANDRQIMIVYRRLEELYAEFASTWLGNWRLTQMDDVGGITKGVDQNGPHALSFANRSRRSGGLSAHSGRTYDMTANGSCGAGDCNVRDSRRARSSSGENTWRAARAVFDKRFDCRSRIFARHDRTDHFQRRMVGGGHALIIPRAKYGLHSVVSLCRAGCQPGCKCFRFTREVVHSQDAINDVPPLERLDIVERAGCRNLERARATGPGGHALYTTG